MRELLAMADLAVCAAGPGVLLLRRTGWRPVERLAAGVGLSLLLVYLAGFAIFAAGLDPRWHWAVSGACWLAAVLAIPEWRRIGRNRQARAIVLCFLLLWAWTLLLISPVREYSGGTWSGDWVEHWQRTRFFLGQLPLNFRFLGIFPLPARPPMMNVLTAHASVIGGGEFAAQQIASAFLNLLVVGPCLLLARRFSPGRARRPWLIAAALALSPVLVANLVYPWTKLFAGAYALLGVWLYLQGWRRRDGARMAASAAALAAGMMVHYSAGPYAVAIAGHMLLRGAWSTKRPFGTLAAAGAGALAIAAVWFAWSISTYGPHLTIGGNTSVADAARQSFTDNLNKMFGNLMHSVVPHPLGVPWRTFAREFRQQSLPGTVRDYAFLIYQPNVIFMMGSAGGIVGWALLRRAFRRRDPEARFWGVFVPLVIVLGIAVVGVDEKWGLGHICLQPLAVLGVTFVAARAASLPRWVRAALLAGWTIDAALGVALPVWLMSRAMWTRTTGGIAAEGGTQSAWAAQNWAAKANLGVTFLGDHLAAARTALLLLITVATLAWLAVLANQLFGKRRRRSRATRPLARAWTPLH